MAKVKFLEKKNQKFNKMYSMRFRVLATVIFAMMAITIFIGGLSIYEVDNYIQAQAKDFVSVTCTNESSQINASLKNMEKSVKIMESYLMDFFTSESDLDDRDLQERVIKSAEQMFNDVANHTSTEGAVSYYFRFDPSISDGKSGLFYNKLNGSNEFVSVETTDLLLYDKDDVEHVGWFWLPYEAGEPIWIMPYHNQNNGIHMISYVIPMYFGEKFIGIVGMDFDYTVLADKVHAIKVYENGFAHLESDGVIMCNHDDEAKIDADPDKYMQVSQELTNGMTLVISASYDDIRQIRYDISLKILFTAVVLSVFFTLIAIFIVKKIVDPLKKLTDASAKLSNGDYNVEIAHSDMYEIKLLSAAFENMTKRLHERERLLRRSANYDSMTGLPNTTSYTTWVSDFDKRISAKQIDFGVVMLDLNDLKETNDKYGHGVGNELIIASAKLISDFFKGSPAFRIGGDEFLVVLQDSDLENHEELLAEFDSCCKNTLINDSLSIHIRIAIGFSKFDAGKDTCFDDVFKRADSAMYENKRKSKSDFPF